MHADLVKFAWNCPECAIFSGGGRICKPLLHPIKVNRPFQIVGVDIIDFPPTKQGNRHVLVFQDYFSKWPMVYPIPDQKSWRIAKILCEDIIPMFGVPEALLSDRGANLVSHLMMDLCQLLGVKKLNTTAYHPQCNGMVERLNRTLKTMLLLQSKTIVRSSSLVSRQLVNWQQRHSRRVNNNLRSTMMRISGSVSSRREIGYS